MKVSYKTVKLIYNIWGKIIDKFGDSKFYSWVPELILYYNDSVEAKQTYGEFCSHNRDISINLAAHDSIRLIISTILHEYCHYLQHPGWYTRYERKYVYEKNPYEIAANQFCKSYIDEFVK